MNRKEFMEQLRRLLYDVPASDREEALEYYEGYFDDAGPENEASVIRELGSPGRIAAEIKAGLNVDPEAGEYTDTGYRDGRYDDGTGRGEHTPARYRKPQQHRGMNSGTKTLLLIVLAVVTFPIWGAVLSAVFTVLMGVFGILLGLLAGTLFGGLGLTIGSVVMVVVGILNMASSFSLGLGILGTGMMLLAIGILLLVGFGWFAFKAIPALIRFLIDLFHRLFHRNRREEAR